MNTVRASASRHPVVRAGTAAVGGGGGKVRFQGAARHDDHVHVEIR